MTTKKEQQIFSIVCEMRSDYKQRRRGNKTVCLAMYEAGFCWWLLIVKGFSQEWQQHYYSERTGAVLEFIKKYGEFQPTRGLFWFPKGQISSRLRLLDKAIAKYKEENP